MSESPNYSWFYPETILDNTRLESADILPMERKRRPDRLKMIPGARPKSRKQMRRHCQLR